MLKYIKSEVFRAFKTPMYKVFLLLSLLGPMVFTILWKFMMDGVTDPDYLNIMSMFSSLAVLIIAGISIIIAYKSKDTKVQILSYGMTRTQMYFSDLVTMQVISFITVLILTIIALGLGFFGDLLGLIEIGSTGYLDFLKFVGKEYLFLINLNNAVFGLTYILNNVALGIISHIITIPTLIQIILLFAFEKNYGKYVQDFLQMQPYPMLQEYPFFEASAFTGDVLKLIGLGLAYVIGLYIIGGLVAFKKREIY